MAKHNPFSSRAFRKGGFSFLMVILFLVVVILLNIVATALSERYPLNVDLTSAGDYTLELEDAHRQFIEAIDKPINIIVCAAENSFDSGTFSSQMTTNLNVFDSTANVKYARQTGIFLTDFSKINPNITVVYRDPTSTTDFAAVKSKYSSESFTYGDIIVECTQTSADGSSYEKYQIVKMSDYFKTTMNQQLSYSYGTYVYSLDGSTLAASITSALYIVTSSTSVKAVNLSGHGTTEPTYLETLLKKNNYEFTSMDGVITTALPSDATFAIISCPTVDFTKEELDTLETFLKNGGQYGKTLIYMPATDQPSLPNLEEFLVEWGIEVLPSVGYGTGDADHYYQNIYLLLQDGGTEYTTSFKNSQKYYGPSSYRLMKAVFDENDHGSTSQILKTASTTAAMPYNAGSDWTPDPVSTEYGEFPVVLMGTQYGSYDGENMGYSHILAVSGDYFFSSDWLNATSCLNSDFTISISNKLAGIDESSAVEITTKTISTSSFADQLVSSVAPTVVYTVFAAVIPLTLIVLGFVFWIVRKRK